MVAPDLAVAPLASMPLFEVRMEQRRTLVDVVGPYGLATLELPPGTPPEAVTAQLVVAAARTSRTAAFESGPPQQGLEAVTAAAAHCRNAHTLRKAFQNHLEAFLALTPPAAPPRPPKAKKQIPAASPTPAAAPPPADVEFW